MVVLRRSGGGGKEFSVVVRRKGSQVNVHNICDDIVYYGDDHEGDIDTQIAIEAGLSGSK